MVAVADRIRADRLLLPVVVAVVVVVLVDTLAAPVFPAQRAPQTLEAAVVVDLLVEVVVAQADQAS